MSELTWGSCPGLRAQALKLRDAIRSAAPEPAESFGYAMPACELNGRHHYGLTYVFEWRTSFLTMAPNGFRANACLC
jgi:hypothetical protein